MNNDAAVNFNEKQHSNAVLNVSKTCSNIGCKFMSISSYSVWLEQKHKHGELRSLGKIYWYLNLLTDTLK